MKAKISEFEILNTKITSELSQCQTEIINTKHHSEKIQKKCEKLMKEKDDLNHEMFESQNSMLKKIREMEAEHELSKRTLNMSMEDYHFDSSKILMSNRADSSFSVTKEMSYFQYNNHDKSEALVNKEVGEYVQKLLMKIANFADKVKKLRNQRDKLKQFYDKYKHVIYPVK